MDTSIVVDDILENGVHECLSANGSSLHSLVGLNIDQESTIESTQ